MNKDEINLEDKYYYPNWQCFVKVLYFDEQAEYARIEDEDGNTADVHYTKLETMDEYVERKR